MVTRLLLNKYLYAEDYRYYYHKRRSKVETNFLTNMSQLARTCFQIINKNKIKSSSIKKIFPRKKHFRQVKLKFMHKRY